MSCCAPGVETVEAAARLPSDDELSLASRRLGDGLRQVELSVPAVHCAACIATIERGLADLEGVEAARVNLSTRRVCVRYRDGLRPPLVRTLAALGHPPHLSSEDDQGDDGRLSELLRAVAVSGFAAGNIMLLSVSVWSGAEGATRDLFHYVSALIALPALLLGGGVFYESAWSALRVGRMNMDVPIAVGVTLAYAMSLYETITHGPHAYFDASVSLLFFLLIGRALDHVMRDRARAAVLSLQRLTPRGALVVDAEGRREFRPVDTIEPGTTFMLAAGERVPVDCRVERGESDFDQAHVTGESLPVPARIGDSLHAGALNLTGPLTLVATARAVDSFLAEMLRMLEAAEGGRSRYRRIAERVSLLYAPVVHLGAVATFVCWMLVDGDWHKAMTIAIAVLIITCPCALGLAVPIVQVVAARRLFEAGVMVRDGGALERLAEADCAVFDKTGTLTLGEPRLFNAAAIDPRALSIATELAAHSRHPLSRAIADEARTEGIRPPFRSVGEVPGNGVEAVADDGTWRLGRASWAAGPGGDDGTLLTLDGVEKARFEFTDRLRPGVCEAIAWINAELGPAEMLSGDNAAACGAVAAGLDLARIGYDLLPAQKVERLRELACAGHRPLMVGDGLNDAPAMAFAHVSMAPASAADIGRNAADFVLLRDGLDVVPLAIVVARRAGRLIRQNIALAIIYNFLAVPVAVLGYVTPLIAAVAMSLSSLMVVTNAMRLVSAGSRQSPPSPASLRSASKVAA